MSTVLTEPRLARKAPELWTSRPVRITLAVAFAASIIYVVEPPQVPDLAAQVLRAHLAGSGIFAWWPGWFGGVSLPSYSPISPVVMAWIGVAATGAISAIVSTIGGAWLFRDTRRPALGLAAFTLSIFVDLFCGRITFAFGLAASILALVMLQRNRYISAGVFGVVSFLASPLAGLFLGLGALAVIAVDPARRRGAIALGAALATAAGAMAVLSPQPGEMPFPWWHMAIEMLCLVVLAVVCPSKYVRSGCVMFGAATMLFFAVPGAIGTNMDRILWLAAAPVALACADLTRLRAIVLGLALLIWPLTDLGIQLAEATTPAATAGFYQPLVSALHAQQAALGPAAYGERVEVVNPASQWSSAYVAPSFGMARGWDRQLDRTDDALFYDGTLTSTTYHRWLSQLAVGWVALPRNSKLDYASVDEAALVRSSPSYLKLVWQNPSWSLFRVRGARPLLSGATLQNVSDDGVRFHAATPGTVDIQMRWSPYLTLSNAAGPINGCLSANGPWTSVDVPEAGTYTITAQLVRTPLPADARCAS